MAVKLVVVLLNKLIGWDIALAGGAFLWNFGPLILMVVSGIGAGILQEKYKKD
ncbi:MAG: DNA-binding protein [Ruminococcus sp.]|nr:DNA-binding protein [Ruminococcus sp.]